MENDEKLFVILSQAINLIDSLQKISESTVPASPIDLCNKLADELQRIDPEDSNMNIGPASWWSGSDGVGKFAHKTEVIAKLAAIKGLIEGKLLWKKSKSKKNVNIFISHGKKIEPIILTQRFVEALGLTALIVKDEASMGGSVNQTVEEYMGKSQCVILLSTADVRAEDGWHTNENVINEEGMAKKYVGNKIIYLLEDAVTITPSNYREKVYERFSLNNMTDAFIKIAKELNAFNLI